MSIDALLATTKLDGYSQNSCWHWTGDDWDTFNAPFIRLPPTFNILTYNVLFDLYDKDKVYYAERKDILVDLMTTTNCDIITLQEVTAHFLAFLLEQDWIKHYFVSSSIKDSTWVKDYGQLIISKFPFEGIAYRFNEAKTILMGYFPQFYFDGEIERNLLIQVVHLTSSRSKNSLIKRLEQMIKTYEVANSATDCILLGDFNISPKDRSPIRIDYLDIWSTLHPNDPGSTFDPENNYLAQVCTVTGLTQRTDRIYLRSDAILPKSIEILTSKAKAMQLKHKGKEFDCLYGSDHYAVKSTLEINKALASKWRSNEIGKLDKGKNELDFFFPKQQLVDKFTEGIRSIVQFLENNEKFAPDTIKTYVIGSAGLKLFTPTSDIDLVCLSSHYNQFFWANLKEVCETNEKISKFKIVSIFLPERLLFVANCSKQVPASITIAKFYWLDIPVDIQFVYCPTEILGKLRADRYAIFNMKNLEPFKPTANESKSLLSIEDKYLLKHYLIPDLHAFKSLYFTIRTWAIRRGIYGSIYGYLGGYGWLILVAYICQLHPQFAFSPIDLLFEFFRKFSQWNWKSPVNLLTGNQIPKCNTSPHDKMILPLISCPTINSVRTMNKDSFKRITDELARGRSLFEEAKTKPTFAIKKLVASLCEPSEFFLSYPLYFSLTISGSHAHFNESIGHIESRLLSLISEFLKILIESCWFPRRLQNKVDETSHSATFWLGISTTADMISSLTPFCESFVARLQPQVPNVSLQYQLLPSTQLPDEMYEKRFLA